MVLAMWLGICHACPAQRDCDCQDHQIVCYDRGIKYIPPFYAENMTYSVIDLGRNKIANLGKELLGQYKDRLSW